MQFIIIATIRVKKSGLPGDRNTGNRVILYIETFDALGVGGGLVELGLHLEERFVAEDPFHAYFFTRNALFCQALNDPQIQR
jgi:hypothetical protein